MHFNLRRAPIASKAGARGRKQPKGAPNGRQSELQSPELTDFIAEYEVRARR